MVVGIKSAVGTIFIKSLATIRIDRRGDEIG